MATPAFAVGSDPADQTNTGTTANTVVTVQADPATTQVTWSSPTVIAFAASADGTLTGPSADAIKIKNESVFPIHVTRVSATEASPFKLVPDVEAYSDVNAIQLSLKIGSTAINAATVADTRNNADCDMGYKNSDSDAISIEVSGKIARTTVNLSTDQAQKAATINWTVAAGQA